VGSRRDCDEFIMEGRVVVNDIPVFEPGTTVNPSEDRVEFDGEPVEEEKFVYYLYNKPVGRATTLDDPNIENTLKPVVESIPQRVFPVGRLDMDSRGLLLLTNDGDLNHRVSHPKYHVDKTYHVRLHEPASHSTLMIMRQKGVHLDGRRTMPADIEEIDDTRYEITLREGRNRQIRRMFAKFDYEVTDLVRVSVGPVELDDLKEGELRELESEELESLRKAVLDE